LSEDFRGKHKNHKAIDPLIKDSVCNHIKLYPTIESHYLRKQTTRTFISGELNISKMHRMYEQYCKENGMLKWANLTAYRRIFNYDFNIGFHIPKKDQCSVCETYKNTIQKTQEVEENKLKHDLEKNVSRKEKEMDKQNAINGTIFSACFDLQAILITPDGEISNFYYKRRLATYNLTFYNMKNGDGACYVWNETIAKRGANEIGSCLLNFLQNYFNGTTESPSNVIFYSDNCAGQNKNKFITSLYIYAVLTMNIQSIRHKFLIVGHTQNEGDCMHYVIEKQKKKY